MDFLKQAFSGLAKRLMANWQTGIVALGTFKEMETKDEVPMDVGLYYKSPIH